jgi:hypothetical protein
VASADDAYTIRRAADGDAGELARLAEATFVETFGHLYPRDDLDGYVAETYTEAACRETLADPRMAYWLAGADGRISSRRPASCVSSTCSRRTRTAASARGCSTPRSSGSSGTTRRSTSACGHKTWAPSASMRATASRRSASTASPPVGKTVDREFILKR